MPASSSHTRHAAIAIFFWLAVTAWPFQIALAEISNQCGEVRAALRKPLQSGYAFLASAASDRGIALLFFINRDGGWILVGVDENQLACQIAQGDSFKFSFVQEI